MINEKHATEWQAIPVKPGCASLILDKALQSSQELRRKEEEIYRAAIEKRFGECTNESAQKCHFEIVDGGPKRLMHGKEVLCEIYPPELEPFDINAMEGKATLTQRYRIY